MGSLTDYAESALVDHIITDTAYTSVATVYLALATADPTDAATGASMNEVANANAYARTAITFAAVASRRSTQTGAVTFPQATGSWGTVTHWAVTDNATHGAGNVLAHGSLGASKAIVNGNTPSVASGEVWVEITASTGLSDYAAEGFLDRMFRNQAFTVSANYVFLTTTTCSDSAIGTEVTGGSYARLQVNPNAGSTPKWTLESGGAVSNTGNWDFTTATASWGTVVAAGIADAVSAGNMLMYDNAVVDQAVGDGDTVRFATGDFDFSQT